MAQVIVRDLDPDVVVSSLKVKAELHGHSLEQELRLILKRAAELTVEEKLALIDRIRAMTPKTPRRRQCRPGPRGSGQSLMLVVDASVALKWMLDESGDQEARALVETGEPLIAPERIIAEVANAAWRRFTSGQIPIRQAMLINAEIPRVFSELFTLAPLRGKALSIAAELHHPVYHCFYLALAEDKARSWSRPTSG